MEKVKNCVICGKPFTTRICNVVCCSDECKAERIRNNARDWQRRRLAAKKAERAKAQVLKKCEICGQEFAPRRPGVFCCSKECSKVRAREHQKAYLKAAETHKKQEAEKAKKRKPESLEAINRKAREAGMTYGQYMVLMANR